MTLQQLKYIIAVDEQGSFLKAAEACSVTQPTLSAMVQKLENELGVTIFDRRGRTVSLTSMGKKIVKQAHKTLRESARIRKIAEDTGGLTDGRLSLSVSPTIAQYILPEFLRRYASKNPGVHLLVKDMRMSNMINGLLDGTLDASIAIAGGNRPGVCEIPLYCEPFVLYMSEHERKKSEGDRDFVFLMKEAANLRKSTFSFAASDTFHSNTYESNSIDALIRLIDAIGGYTLIPMMHINYLTDRQRMNVVSINDERKLSRNVSLYVRENESETPLTRSILRELEKVVPQNMRIKEAASADYRNQST